MSEDLNSSGATMRLKEELMKRLVNAKEGKDLFELLLIEYELNQIDNTPYSIVDIEKIKRLNTLLLEQLELAQRSIFEIKKFNPETSYYYENFYSTSEKKSEQLMREMVQDIERNISNVKVSLQHFDTVKGTKKLIQDLRMMQSIQNFADMWDDDDDDDFFYDFE
jgi:hypothetical protein